MKELPRWQFFGGVSSEKRFIQYNGKRTVIFALDWKYWVIGIGLELQLGWAIHIGPFYLYVSDVTGRGR